MTFTDDELRHLKVQLRENRYSIGAKTVDALIERLEAAELVCSDGHRRWCNAVGYQECHCGYTHWRMVAGK